MWVCGRTFQTEAKQVQRPEAGVCLTCSRNREKASMSAVNRRTDVREVTEANRYQVNMLSRQLEL